ncbi:MAG TPA: DoxX family protein [Thermoanaerobaculia bacterium]|jgi:putative oxidoreductase|nr:DoxX family protein [Thermoanaerobaculia bacterium]
MLRKLMQTDENAGMLIVRLVLGVVMFPHGAQKLLGWFGGQGFSATLKGMTGMGLPAAVVILVIAVEFLGSLSLILGFLGRVSALGYIGLMLGAIFLVHLPNGFFMNWMGNQKGEGIEYHILVIGIALALLVKGSGSLSIDRSMSDKSGYYLR